MKAFEVQRLPKDHFTRSTLEEMRVLYVRALAKRFGVERVNGDGVLLTKEELIEGLLTKFEEDNEGD